MKYRIFSKNPKFHYNNTLTSSYLFYQSGPVKEERKAVDLTFCSAGCGDVFSRAVSNQALENVLMFPAEQ
jgi:hypothetical protein